MDIRKITTVTEQVLIEGGKEVDPVINIAFVSVVIKNPWHGQGFVEDLNPGIDEVASEVGALLAPRVVELLGGKLEAYGKAAIVGMEGEIEHGSALIHTLKFGNHFRDAANATTLLPAVEKRGVPGAVFDIPLKHFTDATIRSHHQTFECRVADAPHADEILIGLVGSSGGRPQQRLADLSTEQ